METIAEYFQQAQLSLAAYGNLQPGMSLADYVAALVSDDVKMATEQAERFANRYTVLSQHSDSNGFSATLFLDETTGQKILAVRGTNDFLDIVVTDVAIALSGLTNQYSNLETYYQQLITEGKLGANELVTLTGHSLGGLLVENFAVDYAGVVRHAYTYNAPGFAGALAQLLEIFGVTAANVPLAHITNLQAQAGAEVITGLGTVLGNIQPVFTEDQGFGVPGNHGIVPLTDALAIYDVFATLDPTLNTDPERVKQITDILKAVSNKDSKTLESTLDALRTLFQENYALGTPDTNAVPTTLDDRDSFYTNLLSLQGYLKNLPTYNSDTQSLGFTVESLVGKDTSSLLNLAQSDIATRYALYKLNPFAIRNADDLYSAINNSSGALNVYNSATNTGSLTEQYFKDRAAFLTGKLWAGTNDRRTESQDAALFVRSGAPAYFEDRGGASTYKLYQGLGPAVSGIPVTTMTQYLFGGSGVDTLAGGNEADNLYGLAGADTLQGGKGNDYLEGGQGTDTYIYTSGDGLDTILDTDGLGKITFDGTVLNGGDKLFGETYKSSDGKYLYTLLQNTTGQDLLISAMGGQIIVKDFQSGEMGINLGTADPLPAAQNILYGDQSQPGQNDDLDAASATDAIYGLTGDDVLSGHAGEIGYVSGVQLYGDAGNDTLYGEYFYTGQYYLLGSANFQTQYGDQVALTGTGAYLFGEAGNDKLLGSLLDDTLDGGVGHDFIVEAALGDDTLLGGTGNDILNGNEGRDIIEGDGDNDRLGGGGGADHLQGGDGHDQLYGDSSYVGLAWDGFGLTQLYGDIVGTSGSFGIVRDAAEAEAGADVLEGGAGNDELYGGVGDDLLAGDADNDKLQGEGGDDILFGGDGDDKLWGDSSSDAEQTDSRLIEGDFGTYTYYWRERDAGPDGNDYLDGGVGDDRMWGGAGNDHLVGDIGNDYLMGGLGDGSADGDDRLEGGEGNDSLFGDTGADDLEGNTGTDILYGGAGNDSLDGGEGSDQLYGGTGDDIYRFDIGSGQDVIHESGGSDLLAFGDGILSQDVTLDISGSDLVVRLNGASDAVTLRNWFGSSANRVEYLQFADGAVRDADSILATFGFQESSGSGTVAETGGTNNVYSIALGTNVANGFEIVVQDDGGLDHLLLPPTLLANGIYGSSYLVPTLEGTNREGNDLVLDVALRAVSPRIVACGCISTNTYNVLSELVGGGIDPNGSGSGYVGPEGDVVIDPFQSLTPVRPTVYGQIRLTDHYAGGRIEVLDFAGDAYFTREGALQATPSGEARTYIQSCPRNEFYTIYSPGRGYVGVTSALTVGSDGNDTLVSLGPAVPETFFYGNAGNDVITGSRERDTMYGGAGGDTMYGGRDYDWYHIDPSDADIVFDNGYGDSYSHDTLVTSGVADIADLTFARDGDDLLIDNTRILRFFERDLSVGAGDDYPYMVEIITGDSWAYSIPDYLTVLGLFGGVVGTDADDTLVGDEYENTLYGLGGRDWLYGEDNDDRLDGGSGMDVLQGQHGDDLLLGGVDADSLYGETFDPYDLEWQRGHDTLDGGAGNDYLNGGNDGDTYLIYRGGGTDYIEDWGDNLYADDVALLNDELVALQDYVGEMYENDGWYWNAGEMGDYYNLPSTIELGLENLGEGLPTEDAIALLTEFRNWLVADQTDTVFFGLGIAPENIQVEWSDDGDGEILLVVGLGNDDFVYMYSYDGVENLDIEQFRFADGRTLDASALMALDQTPVTPGYQEGTDGSDVLLGTFWNDEIDGYDGADVLIGDGRNDDLYGGAGDDVLVGGPGDDYLDGGDGNDVYLVNPEDLGNEYFEYISDWSDPSLGAVGTDTLSFGAGILPGQIEAYLEVDNYSDGSTYSFLGLRLAGSGGLLGFDWIYSDASGQIVDDYRVEHLQFLGSGNDRVFDLAALVAARWDELRASYDANPGDPAFIPLFTPETLATYDITPFTAIAGGQYAVDYATLKLDGTQNADVLSGEEMTENLTGLDGEDTLLGNGGSDLLEGGTGNDVLQGGAGNDTYVFNLGDGVDTIFDIALPGEGNTVIFGEGITSDSLNLGLGSLLVRIGTQGDAIHIENFNSAEPYGSHAIDLFEFSDGSVLTYTQLLELGFDIVGTDGNDVITGTGVTDRILGLAGNDTILAGEGDDTLDGGNDDDVLAGGWGDDELFGGMGNDEYIFSLGDGSDLIFDQDTTIDNADTLIFGAGITSGDLFTESVGNNLLIHIGDDTLTVQDWFLAPDYRIENIQFNDGSNYDAAWLESLSRHAPELVNPVADRSIDEDNPFSFTLSSAFTDADLARGDTLSYSAVLADGTALPAWLDFDPVNGILVGLADNSTIGGYDITVTATDSDGQNISDTFTLSVNNINDAPVLAGVIGNQTTDEDDPLVFTLPAEVFTDDDLIHGDGLTLSASLASGSMLPDWLTFDASTGTFTGTPDNWAVGTYEVQVTATDTAGTSVSDVFSLAVNNVNDVPIVANSILDQATDEDSPYTFNLADVFADDDIIHGDNLTLSAALTDGSILPDWLVFDTTTGTFSGIPDNGDVGTYEIQVTAIDLAGTSASDVFTLTVNNINDNPILANALGDLTADEDIPFSFIVPADTFLDDDFIHGDSLALTASLVDGSVLPDWLMFDATTGTFSGTPDNGAVGTYEIQVTATDTAGTSASDVFSLAVQNTNDAPILANPIPDQLATEGLAFNYVLPGDTFSDDDTLHGDVLAYEATLSDGSVLPSWLTFDAATQTFTGTASPDSVLIGTDGDDALVDTDTGLSGTWDIQVTATDTSGISASDTFTLTLQGVPGNDTLTGGKGNDALNGGAGNDTYLYNQGDGLDTLTDRAGTDTVQFGAGFSFDNVVIRTEAGIAHLRFLDTDGNEGTEGIDITLNSDGSSPIESFTFEDGSTYSLNDLLIGTQTLYGTKKANTIITGRHDDTIYAGKGGDSVYGRTGNDTLYGEKGKDYLYGEGGNDRLYGGKGKDLLNGGAGDDLLDGGKGHNTLIGGKGNDTLLLGKGEDTIRFNLGDGWDTLTSTAKDPEDSDIHFGPGITHQNLWFSRTGNDLRINVLNTDDGMTLEGWYSDKHDGKHGHKDKGEHRPIEEIKTADGSELEAKQIERLVQAMASFTPAPGSGTPLPTEMPQELEATLAGAWEIEH